MTITLEIARALVADTLAAAHEARLRPLAVVVLDAGGNVVAAEREDGTSAKRYDIAHAKAHGAIALGVGSRALMARAQKEPYFVAAATSAIGGALVPVPGGVLLRGDDGTLLGALGVSGDSSDNDESSAVAAIEAAGLVAQID